MAMQSCGCKTGAVFTGAALVGWPLGMWLSSTSVVYWLLYPFVVFVSAVAGKLLGMAIER